MLSLVLQYAPCCTNSAIRRGYRPALDDAHALCERMAIIRHSGISDINLCDCVNFGFLNKLYEWLNEQHGDVELMCVLSLTSEVKGKLVHYLWPANHIARYYTVVSYTHSV